MQDYEKETKRIKAIIQEYNLNDLKFNEPHFSERLILRDGNKKEVINNLLELDNLVYAYEEKGKYNDKKYVLHFKISNTRTMIIPVVAFKKYLYAITYIMRYRPWKNMIKK